MIQGSNKLRNYRLWWLSKPLRLARFESFWIQVCAIVAVSGILGDISLLSLSFLTEFFSMILLLCFSIAFSPFYSVLLESQGTIDSPILLPGYQNPFCAHHLEGWAFPYFSFFLPFDAVSLKAHGLLFYSECACFWCHVPYDSTFGRPSSLSFFLSGRNPTLLVRKFFCYYFLFYSSVLVPRDTVPLHCERLL